MKKFVLLFFCVMSTMFAVAQTNLQDVVYLKNGSVVRGVIVEQIPGVSLKVQTSDGSIFVYNIADVEKMTKEQPKGAVRQVSNYAYSVGATNSTAVSERIPFVAGLLSFLVPGCGQFYNGQSKKGWADLGVAAGAWVLTSIGSGLMASSYSYDYYSGSVYEDEDLYSIGSALVFGGAIISLVNGIASIVDAVKSSKQINVEKGFIMYSFNEDCAFGMQPTLTYEKPQYLMGAKAEMVAGMNLKLTF